MAENLEKQLEFDFMKEMRAEDREPLKMTLGEKTLIGLYTLTAAAGIIGLYILSEFGYH